MYGITKVFATHEPSLKMMGIEAVRSSTPAPIRGYIIKDALNIIMGGTEDDLINYHREEDALSGSHSHLKRLGFPRTANNVERYADAVPHSIRSQHQCISVGHYCLITI